MHLAVYAWVNFLRSQANYFCFLLIYFLGNYNASIS